MATTPSAPKLFLLTLAACLGLAACGEDSAAPPTTEAPTTTIEAVATESTTTEAPTTTTTAAPTTTTEAEPDEVGLVWTPCGPAECASLDVPVDYDDPDGEQLSIAINRLPATDPAARIGVLLVNPGGPGGSGVEFANLFSPDFGIFPAELTAAFDVIGFDPRGVGGSEPAFACGARGEQLGLLTAVDEFYDTDEELQLGRDAVALCEASMGEAAFRLGTDDVARDMDAIRVALGEDQISYLGFSYGSTVGAWYATLFPDSVRAMVLDGADNPQDPNSTTEERIDAALEQARGFNEILGRALSACDSTCPIWNDGDPEAYFFQAIEKLDLVTEAVSGNPDAGGFGIASNLYSESQWPLLYEGLYQLQEFDNPALLADASLFQYEPGDPADARFTTHQICIDLALLRGDADLDVFLDDQDDLDAAAEQQVPLLAPIDALPNFCPFYVEYIEPFTGRLDGGDLPVLVIGNPSDPATPFAESEELALETLSNGRLLVADHADHTVYPANECVIDVVHRTLIDANPPEEQISTCGREDVDPFAELFSTCTFVAADLVSAENVETACDEVVVRVSEALTGDELLLALTQDEGPEVDTLIEIFFGVLEEFA